MLAILAGMIQSGIIKLWQQGISKKVPQRLTIRQVPIITARVVARV